MGTLRLFLAVSVLVTHLRYGRGIFGLGLLNGTLAVECFFIISGFYMALVLNEKYNYRGSYWTFIQQRFLRLYPLYLIVGILILGVEGLITHFSAQPIGNYQLWASAPSVGLLQRCYYGLVNLTILGLDTLWFWQQDSGTGQLYLTPYQIPHATQCIHYAVNGPSWTLAVEISFYLLAPFLVRRSVKIQAGFMLASFLLRSGFYLALGPERSLPWTYYFSPSDLFFFMAGSLGYHFYRSHRVEFEKFGARHWWIFWVFGGLMLDERRLPGKDYFFWLFVPLAIVIVPLLFAHTRNIKWDRLIGELSYPFYLIHFTTIVVLESIFHEQLNFMFGPLCAVVSLGLAYLLYQLIELKTEHFRERLFRKTVRAESVPVESVTPSVSPRASG